MVVGFAHNLRAAILRGLPSTSPQCDNYTVEGTWVTEKADSRITIARDDHTGGLVGRISWLKDGSRSGQRDFRNPNKSLQERTLLGLPILNDFRPGDERREYRSTLSGRIYDPLKGWNLNGNLALDDGGDKLRVKGWVGLGPLRVSKSQVWTRFTEAS